MLQQGSNSSYVRKTVRALIIIIHSLSGVSCFRGIRAGITHFSSAQFIRHFSSLSAPTNKDFHWKGRYIHKQQDSKIGSLRMSSMISSGSAVDGGHPLHTLKISLSDRESRLFDIIRDTLKYSNRPNTVPRVAGGWVRDKLLNLESHDIDIAVNDCSGMEFATCIKNYQESRGVSTKWCVLIQANPEKSKHLETAYIKVEDFEIDCVNLRAEAYSETSRIPQARFGTPLEDAQRRDFTINALFYNILTEEIEDMTGQGISDLRNGILRTPLPAPETFKDDPLRLLRAIRFGSRLNYQLHKDILDAGSSPEILAALTNKVSKERVLSELDQILASKGAYRAITLLRQLGILPCLLQAKAVEFDQLAFTASNADEIGVDPRMILSQWDLRSCDVAGYCTVINLMRQTGKLALGRCETEEDSVPTAAVEPTTVEAEAVVPMDISSGNRSRSGSSSGNVWENIAIAFDSPCRFQGLQLNCLFSPIAANKSTRLIYYAALGSGLDGFIADAGKKKRAPLSQLIFRQDIVLDGTTLAGMATIAEASQSFRSVAADVDKCRLIETLIHRDASLLFANESDMESCRFLREELGVILKGSKKLWANSLVIAAATELSHAIHPIDQLQESTFCSNVVCLTQPFEITEKVSLILHKYSLLQQLILKFQLDNIWDLKPLLDGNEIKALTGLVGKDIKVATEQLFKWQLRYPEGNLEESIAFIKSMFHGK